MRLLACIMTLVTMPGVDGWCQNPALAASRTPGLPDLVQNGAFDDEGGAGSWRLDGAASLSGGWLLLQPPDASEGGRLLVSSATQDINISSLLDFSGQSPGDAFTAHLDCVLSFRKHGSAASLPGLFPGPAPAQAGFPLPLAWALTVSVVVFTSVACWTVLQLWTARAGVDDGDVVTDGPVFATDGQGGNPLLSSLLDASLYGQAGCMEEEMVTPMPDPAYARRA
jgi:hypothetical protein